ncbi:MAG: FG-GAP-like repeat-containing protein, partial [Paludibacter sp.]|nr:FG-GAP-like repeat-containing protein [Paludibacter sp.]
FNHYCRLGAGTSEDRAMVGDFNGDGKEELLVENNSLVTGIDGFVSMGGTTWGTDLLNWFPNNKYQLDFNGDGKTDVFVMDEDGYRIYGHIGTIFTLFDSGSYPNNNTGVYFGDFNGDGKTDLLTQKSSYGSDDNETAIHFATGNDFETTIIPWMQTFQVKLFIGDFNNDGKSDFTCFGIAQNAYNCSFWVGLSKGNDFSLKKYDTNYSYTYATGAYINLFYNADFNGDGREEMLMNHYLNQGSINMDMNFFDTGDESLFVKRITDGAGIQNRIDYSNTSNAEVYTNTDSYTFPVSRLKGNLKVVSSYQQGNNAVLFQTDQQYENARIHKQGKGFLGFEKINSTDVTKGIIYENTMGFNSTYYNTYPIGQIVKTTADSIISTTSLTNDIISLGGKRIFPYVSSQTTTDNLTGLSETKTISNFDAYGNPQSIQTNKGELTETQTISYIQKGSWCPNKPQGINTVITYANQSETKQMEFDYDNNGNLTKEIINPNSPEYKVTTEYKNFNAFGQAQTIEVKAKDADGFERTRSSSMTYTSSGTSKGRFVTSKTNVLGETTTYDWDETRGLLNSGTTKGKTTYYTYDVFGRLKETKYPDGNRKVEVLQWAGGGGPTGAVYYSYAQASGSAPVTSWFDALGREIQKDTYGLNDRKISVSTEYYTSGANKGRLYRVSEPYFEGDTKIWAETYSVYDAYGRPTTVQTPMGNITTAYNGLSTTETTPEATKTTTLNNSGFVVSSTVNEKTDSYTFYPSGLTKTATPQGGQALSMEYNLQGKRTKLTDPDAGVIETKYNGFGELLEEKQKVHSNNFLVTTHQFEPTTGRLNSINRNGEITSYGYDAQNRISSIEIAGQHKQIFSYDDFDRVTNIREEIGLNIYNRETAYDALGRIKKETYPSDYYTVNHYDNDYGFLTEVKDKYGRQIWKVNSENAKGQITEVQRGGKTTSFGFDKGMPTSILTSGIINLTYNFGDNGNLNYRQDNLTNQKEIFGYDGMNRLTNWNIYQNNVQVKQDSIVYNTTTGTISSKSDLDNLTMLYGGNGKPHALTGISGVPTNFPTDSLNVTYTDFKKIKTLTEGNKHYILTYGIDDQRRKSEYKINGITQKTKYYLGDYEEETDNLGNIKKIHYLSGGAILINTNGVETLY